jgi:hypothetical protein
VTEEAGGGISGIPGAQAPRQAEKTSSVRALVMTGSMASGLRGGKDDCWRTFFIQGADGLEA